MSQPEIDAPNRTQEESPSRSIPFHVLTVEESVRALDTSPRGLTTAEAIRRLAAIGPNELEAPERPSPWALLAAQFRNVLIVILLIAVALTAALGHGIEAIIIGVIVVFAALLGFIQEYRAERAMEALREMAAPTARVLRDGDESVIAAREVVPGDVVVLQVGDRIPADLRIIEAVNLQADEAPLTGESVPVEKQAAPIATSISPSPTGLTWRTPGPSSPTVGAGAPSPLPGCVPSSAGSPG